MGDALRISELLGRLAEYPRLEVAVELALIWIVLFVVVRFFRGTRAAGALVAFLFIVIFGALLVRLLGSPRLEWLFDTFLALSAIALLVIFQPELRRALIRIGEASLFPRTAGGVQDVVREIVPACAYLSKARFGGLIVLQGRFALKGLTDGGTTLDAALSDRLLRSIFFPGSALHDLAVVVRGRRIEAAGVQLPLADPEDMPDPSLGSRHRAAVGLTRESDAIVVVVSEETGSIRIAENGRLSRPLAPDDLQEELMQRLGRAAEAVTGDAAGAEDVERTILLDEPLTDARDRREGSV